MCMIFHKYLSTTLFKFSLQLQQQLALVKCDNVCLNCSFQYFQPIPILRSGSDKLVFKIQKVVIVLSIYQSSTIILHQVQYKHINNCISTTKSKQFHTTILSKSTLYQVIHKPLISFIIIYIRASDMIQILLSYNFMNQFRVPNIQYKNYHNTTRIGIRYFYTNYIYASFVLSYKKKIQTTYILQAKQTHIIGSINQYIYTTNASFGKFSQLERTCPRNNDY
eukprot:TRINITY_DN6106_c0_g1_i3.p1 TRINITY_DN6106_c0_g1~~TRINITY_DN6106_c0_g1_i3.p1  ORF type:complete len:222 (+),score=-41.60 TRINITY_DN6106_c0_g1_i3:395-1060(+)